MKMKKERKKRRKKERLQKGKTIEKKNKQ